MEGTAQSEWHGNPLHHTVRCLKRCLVDVIVKNSNLPKARCHVEMSLKFCVLHLIECIFMCNVVKATVVNAHTKRAIHQLYAQKELASRTHCDSVELSQPPLRL
jgi:hypothetical protein